MKSDRLRPAVFHILLALAPGHLHGLGIAKAVDEATQGSMTLGPGTLYRSLKEMVGRGLIVEVCEPPGSDPRRRNYALTESGRAAVGAEAERLEHVVNIARRNRVLPSPR